MTIRMKLNRDERTEDAALNECFDLITPTGIKDRLIELGEYKEGEKEYMKIYNNFRQYRNNYLSDSSSIKDAAKNKILSFFGYEKQETVYKKSVQK